METQWWCCWFLGLTCMLTEVVCTWTAFQHPQSVTNVRINSSAEIVCSAAQAGPMGLYLFRSFHDDSEVVYLSLNDGLVTKETPAAEFKGRVRAAPRVAMRTGLVGFVLQLSPLRREDTDMYYCSWLYFRHDTASIELLNSTGSLIIVRETDPNKTCWDRIYFGILVFFGLAPLLVIAIVLVVRFKRSNRYRVVKSARPARPPHVCQHCPYMITSVNTIDYMDTLP